MFPMLEQNQFANVALDSRMEMVHCGILHFLCLQGELGPPCLQQRLSDGDIFYRHRCIRRLRFFKFKTF
jgi:hypothetical protein